MKRALFAWLGLVPLMIVNGVARQSLYAPHTTELAAHQISTLTGALLVTGYAWLVLPRLRLDGRRDAWRVGGVWLAATVAFEFGFGRFVVGHTWQRLARDYDLLEGRVWVLLLLVILVTPPLLFRAGRGARDGVRAESSTGAGRGPGAGGTRDAR